MTEEVTLKDRYEWLLRYGELIDPRFDYVFKNPKKLMQWLCVNNSMYAFMILGYMNRNKADIALGYYIKAFTIGLLTNEHGLVDVDVTQNPDIILRFHKQLVSIYKDQPIRYDCMRAHIRAAHTYADQKKTISSYYYKLRKANQTIPNAFVFINATITENISLMINMIDYDIKCFNYFHNGIKGFKQESYYKVSNENHIAIIVNRFWDRLNHTQQERWLPFTTSVNQINHYINILLNPRDNRFIDLVEKSLIRTIKEGNDLHGMFECFIRLHDYKTSNGVLQLLINLHKEKYYAPGGPGFQEAFQHFNLCVKNK